MSFGNRYVSSDWRCPRRTLGTTQAADG